VLLFLSTFRRRLLSYLRVEGSTSFDIPLLFSAVADYFISNSYSRRNSKRSSNISHRTIIIIIMLSNLKLSHIDSNLPTTAFFVHVE
jgi:hypothetical protein